MEESRGEHSLANAGNGNLLSCTPYKGREYNIMLRRCHTNAGGWYRRVAQRTAVLQGTRKQDANFNEHPEDIATRVDHYIRFNLKDAIKAIFTGQFHVTAQ